MFNLEECLINPNLNTKLLPVKVSSHLDIDVNGLLVKAIINQTFTNTSDESIEAIHSIPVPADSTLVDFKVHKNHQTWEGSVMAKSIANQAYEEALEEGNSAFQLKRPEEDVFSLALGNLLSKETLSMELELSFPMQWIAGQGQLYLPLVMGERYGRSNLLPDEEIESSFLAEYPLSLTLKLNGDLESANVDSPSHPLIQADHKNVYELKDKAFLDRDLKINFSNVTEIKPSFRVNKHGEGYLGLINLVTPVNTTEVAEPRDVLFVLDCSGSMDGTPMTQLKKVMRNLLGQMRPQDRFNLYPYGSTVEAVFNDIQPVTEDNLLKAKRYIRRNLFANLGGTETLRALLTALMSYKKGQPVDIVLVTDGDVWMNQSDNEFKLVKAYANQENIRIFPIGVGHATTEKTVKELAEMSNGSYVLTNPNEDISFTIESHFKRLFSKPLKISLKTENEWHQIPIVYQGDGIQIPVLFKTDPCHVDIEISSNSYKESYTVNQTCDNSSGIQKWIAYQRYQTLDSEREESFALQHQILTDSTDYLIELTRQESEKTDELPSLLKIPQMEVYESNVGHRMMSVQSSSSSYDEYVPAPKFTLGPIDSNDRDIMFSRKMFSSDEVVPIDALQEKQIKELIDYLNKVTTGEVNFEIIKLVEFDLSEGMLDSLRLMILCSDEDQAIKLLLQLCTNHSDWSRIEDKLDIYVSRFDRVY